MTIRELLLEQPAKFLAMTTFCPNNPDLTNEGLPSGPVECPYVCADDCTPCIEKWLGLEVNIVGKEVTE